MWVHPMPDPVALSIGPLHIRWYGLMYLAAFAQYVMLARVRIKQPHIARDNWTRDDIDDMLFYGVLGVIVGGRLGQVFFYDPVFYFSNPLEIIKVWNGGMSFHGGFLGVLIAMGIWSNKRGRNVLDVWDFIAPMVPLGYAFGRLGNFINAELPGRIADATLPWAMIWPNVDNLPRHPSPLYQTLEGVIEFVLLWAFARKDRPRMAVGGMFCLLSGIGRFVTEYFRVPDYNVSFAGITISAGQMFSIPLIVVGIVMLAMAYRRAMASA
ncbi:MAG TPA: prolipoprotein diacylglyceryl transferase [Oxalicibacterium sp.]|nr:prolipoprotein diacylglyceryl transferase [Oxalicibacterium sp.]